MKMEMGLKEHKLVCWVYITMLVLLHEVNIGVSSSLAATNLSLQLGDMNQ